MVWSVINTFVVAKYFRTIKVLVHSLSFYTSLQGRNKSLASSRSSYCDTWTTFYIIIFTSLSGSVPFADPIMASSSNYVKLNRLDEGENRIPICLRVCR